MGWKVSTIGVGAIAVSAGILAAVACSGEPPTEGVEVTSRSSEALTQSFILPVPVGFNPQDVVLGATGVVNVNDAAQVQSVAPGQVAGFWGNVVAMGIGPTPTNIGASTQVGVVWSRSPLTLRGGTLEFYRAFGSVNAQVGTTYRRPAENRTNAIIRPDQIWTVNITAPDSGTDINVNPNDPPRTLASGNYGRVTVNGGTLILSGTSYGFVGLTLNSGSTVQLTNSVAPRIFVRDTLIIRAPLIKLGMILGYLGSSSVPIEAGFQGDLFIAPNANVEIKAHSIGHFFARNLTVFEQMNVRGPALSQASQEFVRPTSSAQRRGLMSFAGAAEIGSALLPTGNGCTEPRAFVSYHGGSLFHRPVSTIGTTTNDVVNVAPFPDPTPTPAPASCVGILPGHDHNPEDGPDVDPPLWPVLPGGRPFYSDIGAFTDNLTTRLPGGRVVDAGFSVRYCEDQSAGLPQGASCPGAAPTPGGACDAVTNQAACFYGATHCRCAPSCWTSPAPCTANTQCCSGTCSGGTCTAPASAPGTWTCGPLNRAEVGTLGVRMTTDCGATWTAAVIDPYALGFPISGGARSLDRQEIHHDPFDQRLYVTFSANGALGAGAQRAIYSASTNGVASANNLAWQEVRPSEPTDAAPVVMTTILDEQARLNTTPETFGRYVHFVTARCTGNDINGDTRPDVVLDIQTPFGRKQWALVEGDSDPSTICNFVAQGTSQPFPGLQFGPSIVGVSSSPPRVLIAYTGNSNTTPQYTVINVYSATIRSENGYAVRPIVHRVHRVDLASTAHHSLWPQLIAPDGVGGSIALEDTPVVLRWSDVAVPNVTEKAQTIYSGLAGQASNIVFWSIPETFPGINCPTAGLGCFVGDYKYGAFFQKTGSTLSFFTPWTGGGRDPATNAPIGYSTANGAFVDVVP